MNRWVALGVLCLGIGACSSEPAPAGVPADVALVSEDVARFWAAYDAGVASGDLETALELDYRQPGSPHLDSFFEWRVGSSADLAGIVERNRPYYDSVRAETLELASGGDFWAEAQAAFADLERIEPAVVFPPVALVIGRLNSGGITSDARILVALEVFTRQADSPTETLTPAELGRVRKSDHLVPFIVHHLVHVQQLRLGGLRSSDGRTLLERALFEGIAEFAAEQLTGRVVGTAAAEYAASREEQIWAEFQAEMDGTDVTRWLGGGATDGERPSDLGYFMGHRIARAYAAANGGWEVALSRLLRATDARSILTESRYLPL